MGLKLDTVGDETAQTDKFQKLSPGKKGNFNLKSPQKLDLIPKEKLNFKEKSK